VVRENGYPKMVWDYIILIFAIINSFTIPLQFGWTEIDNYFVENESLNSMDTFINVCFTIDIALSFITTYQFVSSGDTIWSPKLIAKRYVFKGMFFIDFLSVVPFFVDITGVTEYIADDA
jgi:hypothetical protein